MPTDLPSLSHTATLDEATLDRAAEPADAPPVAVPAPAPVQTWARWPVWARVAHVFFIVNLIAQMTYAAFQVFVVMQPEGVVGPMFGQATSMPFEMMMIRRMYAIEAWIAFGILAIYLGVTELLPRTRTA